MSLSCAFAIAAWPLRRHARRQILPRPRTSPRNTPSEQHAPTKIFPSSYVRQYLNVIQNGLQNFRQLYNKSSKVLHGGHTKMNWETSPTGSSKEMQRIKSTQRLLFEHEQNAEFARNASSSGPAVRMPATSIVTECGG